MSDNPFEDIVYGGAKPKTLLIGIPTRDEYMIGRTIGDISAAAILMKRLPLFLYGVGTNLCAGRDLILKLAKENAGADSCRMLWLDSDIWIRTPAADIAKYLQEADDKNYNIIAPYRRLDQDSSVNSPDGKPFKWDELGKLEQHQKVLSAGMGFYYGDTPLNYKFYMSGDVSEDHNFFADNKLEPRIDKRIELYHSKRIFI